jgi:sec-independent protein translocase protein TatB
VFDVGFAEVVLCFLVALVVLGPQKLPGLARTLGHWTGRARSYMRNLSAELERETGQAGIQRELTDAARALREGADAMKADVRKLGESVTAPPPASAPSPPAGSGGGERKP